MALLGLVENDDYFVEASEASPLFIGFNFIDSIERVGGTIGLAPW